MDLSANINSHIKIEPGETSIIPTGFLSQYLKLWNTNQTKIGISSKNQISILNTPGTIDADYRGEIKVILINLGKAFWLRKEQIAQMVLSP